MTALAMQCEHKVMDIVSRQERYGIKFDKVRAQFLIHSLSEQVLAVDREAVPQLPKMMITGTSYKKVFKLSGKPYAYVEDYCKSVGLDTNLVRGRFSQVYFVDFDMSKTAKVKTVMLDNGWRPTEWNTKDARDFDTLQQRLDWTKDYIKKNFIENDSKKTKDALLRAMKYRGHRGARELTDYLLELREIPTSPKVTEDSLDSLEGDIGSLLSRRCMLTHRRSLLQGLVRLVRKDGRISASGNPCATPTFRANYRGVVNIPAKRSLYGKPIRRCFTSDSKDHVLIGSDASGLELRMLAHYMNDPVYSAIILNGDIHTHHQTQAGLDTRDQAKTFIYGAILYGGGDALAGSMIGGTKVDGKAAKERFFRAIPSLAKTIEDAKRDSRKGYLIGLDGRKILMRKGRDGKIQEHKALNTRLQSAGALVMKYAMIILDQGLRRDGIRAHQVNWQHDEVHISCHKRDIERVLVHTDNYVRLAGEFLNLNIPLASESIVGRNWYDVH
ncbi:DNA polymerase [Akkermansiaceae bacterium]|nr:DNA polymerase [Akkermansiaceae bacterium]